MITVDQLVELAKEVDKENNIDWGMLNVDEDTAYKLIATNVLEIFNTTDQTTMLATVTNLIVENFVLNLKLLQKEENVN